MRAFGVMLGGSISLISAAGASLASTAAALARRRRPHPLALSGTGAFVAYVAIVRPWLVTWGATPAEQEKPLPGDPEGADPRAASTRAVTIEASVENVWPWLAQVGQDRGGFYSYEWLENLAGCRMSNADRVHPDWQRRDVGDKVYLHPAFATEVAAFEPGRVLALRGWGAFVLEPLEDGRTRLLARGVPASGMGRLYNVLLMEIPHFVMERKMLLGIKERAEQHGSGARGGQPLDGVSGEPR